MRCVPLEKGNFGSFVFMLSRLGVVVTLLDSFSVFIVALFDLSTHYTPYI